MPDSFSRHSNLTATIVVTPTTPLTEAAADVGEFEQLMRDLASGSEDAAWKIAETYTPHILRVVRHSLPGKIRSKLDSQDFAQIVWASILLKRTSLKNVKSPDQLIDLLARVTQYKVIDAFRHYTTSQGRDLRRETPLEDLIRSQQAGASAQGDTGVLNRSVVDRGLVDRNPSPSQFAGMKEKWQMLIGTLSRRDRRILTLRIRGETYVDIANKLSIGRNTAKRVLDRIVAKLRS